MADDLVSIRIRLAGGREVAGELRTVKGEMSSIAPTTARAAASSNRSLSRMRRGWTALKKVAKIGLGALAGGLAVLATQVKPAISATEDLAKGTISLHENFGIGVKRASEFAAVASARGVDSTKLGMAFKTLSKQLVSANDGSKTSIKLFKKLGLDSGDVAKGVGDVDFAVRQVADGLNKVGPGANRAAAAATLLGKGFQPLLPVLRDGSKALQEQLDLANKYGATFKGKDLKTVQDLIGAQRELKLAQLGVQVQFTEKIAPALIDVGLAAAHFINQMRTGKGAGAEFARVMKNIWGASLAVYKAIRACWKVLRWLAFPLIALPHWIKIAVSAFNRTKIALNGVGYGATRMADRFAAAFQWCVRAAENFVGFIKGLPGKFSAAGRGAWNWIKNGFRSAINFVIDGWNSLHFHIPEIDPPGPGPKFGGMDVGVPPIPRLAAGGVAVRGGWSIVGERGPEMRYMPRGAQVEPIRGARGLAGRGRGGGARQPIVLQLDGRVLAETTVTLQEDAEARA